MPPLVSHNRRRERSSVSGGTTGAGTGLRRWRGCFIDPCIENDPGARLFSLVFRPPVGRPRSLAAQGSIGYRSGFWIVVSSQVQGGSVDGEQGGSGAEVEGNSGGCGRLGKMIVREAFPDGLGLDVTLADMEEYSVAASRAVVKGAVESMTAAQGGQLGEEAPCPTCGNRVSVSSRRARRFPTRIHAKSSTASRRTSPRCRLPVLANST